MTCPCGAPMQLAQVTAATIFGDDRRQATVAACTGCERVQEIPWRTFVALTKEMTK